MNLRLKSPAGILVTAAMACGVNFACANEQPASGHGVDTTDDGDADADPWDYSVFEPDGDAYRDVLSIPTNPELAHFLSSRLGEYDPLGQLAREAQRAEDARCGRVSQP